MRSCWAHGLRRDIGAFLLTSLTLLSRRSASFDRCWSIAMRMLLFGLALVLMMIFRPAGLWPSTQRQRELVKDDELHPELYDEQK